MNNTVTQGLGRKKHRPKLRKRWWWRALAGVIAATGGVVGALIGAAMLAAKGGVITQDTLDTLNPTEAEVLQAQTILTNNVSPLINNLDAQIKTLQTATTSNPIKIIADLNQIILKIATLQAWVSNRLESEANKVLYMVAAVLEPMLIKLNTQLKFVLIAHNLQANITKNHTSFVASNTPSINGFNLSWTNNVVSKYEKLTYTAQTQTTTVDIIGNTDNPELVSEIANIPIAQIQDDTDNKFSPKNILIGLGLVGLAIKLAQSSDKKTAKKKGLAGKKCGKDRYACKKGIDQKTGNTKKGYSRGKGGTVIKKVEGLNKNGRLKKGYKFKNGKPVKVTKKKGLKAPVILEL